MGISGLLKELQSISKSIHIKELAGLRVAIDAHCWLHRGAVSCARELLSERVRNNRDEADTSVPSYVRSFMSLIELLKVNGITQILVVFDGCALPAKARIHSAREESRRKVIEVARAAEEQGKLDVADSYYKQGVTITFEMVTNVINELKAQGIPYLVSPYESDAQLTFFSNNNIVDCVFTEDSDLVVFGCRRIIFKLDRSGGAVEIKRNQLGSNTGALTFLNWTDLQFKLFCCLSGCDYVKNINMLGIKKAHKLVEKYKTLPALAVELRRLYQNSDDFDIDVYLRDLERALLTFQYQTVFNPMTMSLEPLCGPLPPAAELFTVTGTAHRQVRVYRLPYYALVYEHVLICVFV